MVIRIGADASEVVSASKAAASSLGGVSAAADRVDRSAKAAASSLSLVKRDVEAASRVLKLANPAFGELGERFNGVISAMSSGAGRFAVIGGAVAAVTAGFVALTSAVIDTAANIDDLEKRITATNRLALAPQIAALRETRDAMAGLSAETTALQIVMSAEFAPALTEISDALAGVTVVATQAATAVGTGEGRGVLDAMKAVVAAYSPTAGALLTVGDAFSEVGKAAREAGVEVSDYYAKLAGKTTASGVPLALSAFGADPTEGIPEALRANAEAPVTAATRAARPRAAGGVTPDEAAAAMGGTVMVDQLTDPILAANEVLRNEQADHERRMADIQAEGFATRARLQREAYDAQIEAARNAREAEQAAMIQTLGDFQGASSALFAGFAAVLDATAGKTRDAQLRNFEEQKAIAVAQAAVSAALAGVQAIASSGGQPIVAAINLAAIIALAASQIAVIASSRPSFHRGGVLAPDEEQLGPAVVRRNERVAVLTQQGFEAVGGDRGLRDLNAGERRTSEPTMFFVLEDGLRRVRRLARPVPGYGIAGAR